MKYLILSSLLILFGWFFVSVQNVDAQACTVGVRTGACIDLNATCDSGITGMDSVNCGGTKICCASSAGMKCADVTGKSCQTASNCKSGTSLSIPLDCTGGQVCCEPVASSTNTCTSNCGTNGICSCAASASCTSPKTTVSAGNSYCNAQTAGNVCCKTPTSTGTCSGGSCKATCATGETEDTTCSASQCASEATNKKYCKTGSGGGTTTEAKCKDGFEEYAGVCFPTNTGLSKLGIIDIAVNLMKWMLYLFGFLAIISFVVSGIQYLAASGNASMIETAKRNMTYSIVGVIVALAGLVIITAIDALLKGTAWGG